jgi:RNA polymerase sigma factor (sigma-70 family)
LNINQLYSEARGGDEGARKRLFRELSESFGLFVQHRIWDEEDSREVVQDALMTISDKYTEIEFETSFAAWAYRVLENKMLQYYRTKGIRAEKIARMPDNEVGFRSWNPDPELKRRLLDCLRKVSGVYIRHARILNLHYQGYTVTEICERLKLTRNNAYILLSRARAMLKLCLETGDIR